MLSRFAPFCDSVGTLKPIKNHTLTAIKFLMSAHKGTNWWHFKCHTNLVSFIGTVYIICLDLLNGFSLYFSIPHISQNFITSFVIINRHTYKNETWRQLVGLPFKYDILWTALLFSPMDCVQRWDILLAERQVGIFVFLTFKFHCFTSNYLCCRVRLVLLCTAK